MKAITFDNITVTYDDQLTPEEISTCIDTEKARWRKEYYDKQLGELELTIDNEEIVIKSRSREPISRIRRITGYLSKANNFNDAKRAELRARQVHFKVR